MGENIKICTVMPIQKPKRKLIILRAIKAHNYWSFCEEKGCEWEGLLNSIPNKLDTAAIIELPEALVNKGTSKIVAGVEVPSDEEIEVPEKYETIEIEACTMLYFISEPFTDEKDFDAAIHCLFEAYQQYDPNQYGYVYEKDNQPSFNFGASPEMGARLAFPVRKKAE